EPEKKAIAVAAADMKVEEERNKKKHKRLRSMWRPHQTLEKTRKDGVCFEHNWWETLQEMNGVVET
ncbi:hypothetical protein ACH5RR_041387, partial [Cinchona calisaya]